MSPPPVLARPALRVVEVELPVLDGQLLVPRPWVLGGADPRPVPALAVHQTPADVELKLALDVSVGPGPLVVLLLAPEAAEVEGEAGVGVRDPAVTVPGIRGVGGFGGGGLRS